MELKEYLRSRNFDYYEFAHMLGVTVSALSNYVHRRREPRKNIRLKIVELTKGKVTLEDLLKK